MNKNLYTLSLDSIKYILGLIRDTVDLPANILDDLHIQSTTTYSSYRLDTLLKALKEENIQYCDEAISKLNKLSKEIITDKLQITNENTIYLLLTDPVNNIYEQWLLINGTPQMIGTTEMKLDSVYTKDEADDRYALLTDFNTLTTSFNNLATTVEKKIDKDNIVTVLDDTVTDEQVASAKAVYDSVKDKNLKTYTALSQFNKTIDDINSLVDLCVSMGANSQFTISVNSSTTQTFYDKGLIPINATGSLAVYNYNLRGYAFYVTSSTIYYRNANNTTVDSGWNEWRNMSENQLYVQPITSGTMDFNTYTKNGVYSFSKTESTLVNSPSLVNGWLMVLNDGGNCVKQIVYRLGTKNSNSFETYERLSTDKGSTWSNWTLITNPSYIKTFTDLNQIGLTNDKTATLVDIWTASGDRSMLIFETAFIADSEIPNGCVNGVYEIYKWSKFRGCIRFTDKDSSGNVYSMALTSDGSPNGIWRRLCATSVKDVSRKRMTFSDETYCKPINAEEGVVYEVKNGICFVHVKITNTLTSTNLQYKTFCTGLPKPSATASIGFSATDRDFKGSGANFVLTLNGELQILCVDTTNTGRYYTMFSYPVAE